MRNRTDAGRTPPPSSGSGRRRVTRRGMKMDFAVCSQPGGGPVVTRQAAPGGEIRVALRAFLTASPNSRSAWPCRRGTRRCPTTRTGASGHARILCAVSTPTQMRQGVVRATDGPTSPRRPLHRGPSTRRERVLSFFLPAQDNQGVRTAHGQAVGRPVGRPPASQGGGTVLPSSRTPRPVTVATSAPSTGPASGGAWPNTRS